MATARQRPESCHYRLAWDPALLGWVLSYDGQMWWFVSHNLPGRPPIHLADAQRLCDGLLGTPQPWQADGDGARAVPAP